MTNVKNSTILNNLQNLLCIIPVLILITLCTTTQIKAQQLDIKSPTEIPVRVSSNNNNLAMRLDYNSDVPGFEFFVNSADGLNICESGVACNRFFIEKTTGNIGIGTSSPNARLDVISDAEINGLRVGRGPGGSHLNTAIGINALSSASAHVNTTAIGYEALRLDTGGDNTAVGTFVLNSNTTGIRNVAVGVGALSSNTTGTGSTAIGWTTLQSSTGSRNSGFGESSMQTLTTGTNNVAYGYRSLYLNSTGSGNTAIGSEAGNGNLGDENVFIGRRAGFNETGSNKLYISNSDTSTPLIYGDFATSELMINGTMHISETAKLEPLAIVPGCAAGDAGTIYFDSGLSKLRVCDGSSWVNLH